MADHVHPAPPGSATQTGTVGTITVSLPTSLTGTQGSVLDLAGISATDTGATASSAVTATVISTTGTLGLHAGPWIGEATGSPDGHTLTLLGTLDQVDQGLAALAYESSAVGTDTVSVALTDAAGNGGGGLLSVVTTAMPVGTTGTITLSAPTSLDGTVGQILALAGLSIADTGAVASTTITATVTDADGTLGLLRGTPAPGAIETSDGHTLTLTGTLDQVNREVAALAYQGSAAGTDTVSVTVTDSVGNAGGGTLAVVAAASTSGTGTTSGMGTTSSGGTSSGTGTASSSGTTSSAGPTSAGTTLTGTQAYTATTGGILLAEGSAATVTGGPAGSVLAVFARAGTLDVTNGAGSAIVVDQGATAVTVDGGASGSSLLAFLGADPASYVGDAGTDEVVAGSGALSVTGGTGGSLLLFGGRGTLQFAGGGESDTVIGGAGAETISVGAAGGAVFAGTGGSVLSATAANTFLAGAVGGDSLTAAGAGGDILAAGRGNETLNGSGASGSDLLFGGSRRGSGAARCRRGHLRGRDGRSHGAGWRRCRDDLRRARCGAAGAHRRADGWRHDHGEQLPRRNGPPADHRLCGRRQRGDRVRRLDGVPVGRHRRDAVGGVGQQPRLPDGLSRHVGVTPRPRLVGAGRGQGRSTS